MLDLTPITGGSQFRPQNNQRIITDCSVCRSSKAKSKSSSTPQRARWCMCGPICGRRCGHSRNLIRELGVVRRCLLAPETRTVYDRFLRQQRPVSIAPHMIASSNEGNSHDSAGKLLANAVIGDKSAPLPPRPAKVHASDSASSPFDFVEDLSWPPTWESELPTPIEIVDLEPSIYPANRRQCAKYPIAMLFTLIMWAIGAAVGALAGYAALCIVNSKYDYLHLFNAQQPAKMDLPGVDRRDGAHALLRPKPPQNSPKLNKDLPNVVRLHRVPN